jgi:hypothetical protein
MLARLAIAGLLLAHAAIHVAFVAPSPPVTADGPAWPFTTSGSWILSRLGIGPGEAHALALALVAVTLAAFALAAIAAVGIVPLALWTPAIVMGSAASLTLLITFFHPWLVLGVAIDVALMWLAVAVGWAPGSGSIEA